MSNLEIPDEVQAAAKQAYRDSWGSPDEFVPAIVNAAVPLALVTQFARIEDRSTSELEPLLEVTGLKWRLQLLRVQHVPKNICEHALRIVREEMAVDQNG